MDLSTYKFPEVTKLLGEYYSISERLKEKALKEYQKSLLMPRKKKKKAKKSALLLYSVASHTDDILNY